MNCFKSGIIKTHHGFFTRHNGVSKQGYESLNCSFTVGDDPKNVEHNLDIICRSIGSEEGKIVLLNQVHGKDVLVLNSSNWNKYTNHNRLHSADALVTDLPEIAIGVLTADCAPILFYDHKNQVAGAAHSGWRGAFHGIIESTITAMKNIGGEVESTSAVIGPCIHKESYSVGPEMFETLVSQSKLNKKFFLPDKNSKYFFDLPGYTRSKLSNLGISDIDVIDINTFTDKNFFSYRRSNLEKKFQNCGRQISVICLKKS